MRRAGDLFGRVFSGLVGPGSCSFSLDTSLVDRGGHAVAQAEVFTSPDQWGVRLFDRIPQVEASDLVRLVARLLVWHAQCPTETVELVIMRRGVEKQTMVRVAGDYV